MTARRLNWVLAIILVPMTVLAFLSAGAAVWMWRNPGAVMVVRQTVETYPAPLRKALRAEFRASRADVADDVARLDAARRRVLELLKADPLDEDAVRAAMAEVRTAVSDLQAVGQEHLLKVMRAADPAERAKIRVPETGFSERMESFAD
ncbi:MAG: hypothetical protein Kow0026_10630 [Oricola sp.]